MSAHCTTVGYATREHSSFSLMWSRQPLVFPEDHCEQALNPPLVGSRPTAGLYSNIQICEARRRKLLRRGGKKCKFTLLHSSAWLETHCVLFLRDPMCPPATTAAVPLWNAFKLTHLYAVPYNHIRHAFSLTVDLSVYGIRKAFFYFPLLKSTVILLHLCSWWRSFVTCPTRLFFCVHSEQIFLWQRFLALWAMLSFRLKSHRWVAQMLHALCKWKVRTTVI